MRIEKNLSRTLQQLMVSSKESMGTLLGAWKSAITGQGLEVKEIRPFSPGDNPLAAVWSRFAQTGTLYSKVFQEERDRTVYLALDRSGSMFQERGEEARFSEELFSYLAWAACESHDRVGAIFGQQVMKPRSGRFQAELLIQEALQPVSLPNKASLSSFFQTHDGHGLKRSLLFYISDFWEPETDWNSLFLQLAHRHEVVLIAISNEEPDLEKAVGLPCFDPEKVPFQRSILTKKDLLMKERQQKVEQERVTKAAEQASLPLYVMDPQQECLKQLIELLEKKRRGSI